MTDQPAMAASVSFAIVDVFSTTPFTGNPLAVVNNMYNNLSDTQMRLLTRQFNLSETTFFSPPSLPGANFRLRSFLPDGKEVSGAGHNILGAWWYLARAGFLDMTGVPQATHAGSGDGGPEEFVFHQELGGGVMPVKVLRHRGGNISISLRQARPQSHTTHPDPEALAASFGLGAEDIGFAAEPAGDGGANQPDQLRAQVMSTSTTRHLIVPLSSSDALDRVAVRRDRLLEQLAVADENAYGLYLFTAMSPGDRDDDDDDATSAYQARFFSPGMSGEDPATGSAAGPLAAYLYRHGHLRLDGAGVGRIVVYQGLKVGRRCVMRVELSVGAHDGAGDEEERTLEVDIVGGGAQVAEGRIAVPDSTTVFP